MNITDGLSRQAALQPWAVAVLLDSRIVHYITLERMVWQAASWLRRQGVERGQVVGLTLANPLTHLVVALALARFGALQVTLAPAEPATARRRMAALAGVSLVVADAEDAGEAGLPVLRPEAGWLAGDGPVAHGLRHEGGAEPWIICQSSGTTGEPKLFRMSHEEASARNRRRELAVLVPGPNEVFFSPVTLDFPSWKLFVVGCLGQGGCLVLDRQANAGEAARLLDARRVSHLFAPPPWIAALLRSYPGQGPRFPALRVLGLTAGASDEPLRKAILERLSKNLFVAYGTNDAGGISIAGPAVVAEHPGTIGTVVEGLRWQVVDEEDRPVPPGVTGRLRVAGPGVVQDYLDAGLTALHVKDGWFYPGDAVSADPEGRLRFHGRVDDMMILDGINIYPAEIEEVLLAHPAVAEAAAFPLRVFSGRDVPMAAVVLRHAAEEAGLLAWARERLGVRVPQRIFVLDALPKSSVGKVLRRELAARLRRNADA
ncbi:class I adenylate-forming enzyme family protein [Marinimicrococcus flavescens]|uniref:Long-chain fatty acid--CoA ligase n=1 Tax=Marinimicrococcus flavescens TaxID=3031815 RepID=A0AAP3XRD3_9PROT|nr:long-chain fatty acid--CoA ligase [Marinimicrococcus flavescens]